MKTYKYNMSIEEVDMLCEADIIKHKLYSYENMSNDEIFIYINNFLKRRDVVDDHIYYGCLKDFKAKKLPLKCKNKLLYNLLNKIVFKSTDIILDDKFRKDNKYKFYASNKEIIIPVLNSYHYFLLHSIFIFDAFNKLNENNEYIFLVDNYTNITIVKK